ncbi:MAG: hypothetical protein K0U84_21675 [Actinomycetia bacterium]|nr:hypothetical protein [Actinomycetes bacterium]
MNVRIVRVSSPRLPKVPRWMAWRSMMPNQTSTRLSQDADVGVKPDLYHYAGLAAAVGR